MEYTTNKPKFNPYDFANPVSDINIFTGRKKQLDDIRYYLEQASEAPRAINLALLGNRAAGKTSLLNMISVEADNIGFCVVRIDLNEGDVENQLVFFFKLIDSILAAAFDRCDENGNFFYGGKRGNTYDAYLDMTCSYEVPDNKLFAPFLFPIQYAKAMCKGVNNIIVSDSNIKQDLATISAGVKAPIALLFDECNVLTNNRKILEMLRNIFMNLPGYMLVFTGTLDLFPIMDDVFSPIVRQFKRIDVDPFVSLSEIRECIIKPLRSIGIDKIPEEIERSVSKQLPEIRSITGGKPYEIQLLCHFMFKRWQLGMSDSMNLSLEVFDDVIKELTRGKDLHSRDVITKIKEIDDRAIKALKRLTYCCGKATFEELWVIEYLLFGESLWKKSELYQYLEHLIESKILTVETGSINFCGDDFDKIYSKYYSRQHRNINLSINEYPQEELYEDLLERKLNKSSIIDIDGLRDETFYYMALKNKDSTQPMSINNVSKSEGNIVNDIFRHLQDGDCSSFIKYEVLVSNVYWILEDFKLSNLDKVCLINIVTSTSNFSSDKLYYYKAGDTLPETVTEELNYMKERAKSLGVQFNFKICYEIIPSTETIINSLNKSAGQNIKEMIAEIHVNKMVTSYLEDDKINAKRNADIALALDVTLGPASINNTAYLFLAFEEYHKAYDLLKNVVSRNDCRDICHLALYNLGIVEIKLGTPLKSIEHFTRAIDLLTEVKEPYLTACLFTIYNDNGNINFTEKQDQDLELAARNAIDVINNCTLCSNLLSS